MGAEEPSVTASTPPILPCTLLPSTCCGFVCGFGGALAFSTKKPTLTTRLTDVHTLELARRLEKQVTARRSCPTGNAIGEQFDHEVSIKSPKSQTAEIFSILIADRAWQPSPLDL